MSLTRASKISATWVSAFFALLILAGIPYQLEATRIYNGGWRVGEWLITYSGGFVRRGLGGSIIYKLSADLGIEPIPVIWIICVASMIALVVIFFASCRGIFSLDFLLSPAILGAPTIGPFLVRKDVFCMACFGICLIMLHHQYSFFAKLWCITAINIVSIVALLTHEAYGFYGIPALCALLTIGPIIKDNHPLSLGLMLRRTLPMMPSIACFILVLVYKGNVTISLNIHNAWREVSYLFPLGNGFSSSQPPSGSISDLQLSTLDGIRIVYNLVLKRFSGPINAFLAYLLTIFIVYNLFVGDLMLRYSKVKATVMLFQLLCLAPLFVIAHDWGRWIFMWAASSALVTSFLVSTAADDWHSPIFDKLANRLLPFFSLIRLSARNSWILLFLGIPAYMWSIKKFILSTPVFHFAQLFKWYVSFMWSG